MTVYRVDGKPVFKIEYAGPGDEGQQIVNQGWRLYRAGWHRTRFGTRCKNKYPRWKLMGVYENEQSAISAMGEL